MHQERDHPERVEALVISSSGFFSDGKWHGMAEGLRTEGTGEQMLGAIASRFIAVSTSVSPFTTLDEAIATLRVSALRRFSAISNEVRVRVLVGNLAHHGLESFEIGLVRNVARHANARAEFAAPAANRSGWTGPT